MFNTDVHTRELRLAGSPLMVYFTLPHRQLPLILKVIGYRILRHKSNST
jgi:hypothetical protein